MICPNGIQEVDDLGKQFLAFAIESVDYILAMTQLKINIYKNENKALEDYDKKMKTFMKKVHKLI